MWLDELLYGTQTTFYEGHKRAIVTILQYELFQCGNLQTMHLKVSFDSKFLPTQLNIAQHPWGFARHEYKGGRTWMVIVVKVLNYAFKFVVQ